MFKKLSRDKRGLAWIWLTAAITFCFLPFVYFVLKWPLDMLWTAIAGQYTYTGSIALAFQACNVLISYLLAFSLFGLVMWSLVNAKASSYGG